MRSKNADPDESAARKPRKDALANQERVLAAAVTATLHEGNQVPMAEIARRAGVGVGTLYRRFPNREALLGALTERSFTMVRDLSEDSAAREESGLASVEHFLDGTIEHREQLVLPMHGGPAALSDASVRLRDEIRAAVARVVERGHEDGTLREDLVPIDVIMFGAMLAQPLPGTPDWDDVARRQKDIFLTGVGRTPDLTDTTGSGRP
jgi:AcrR family transcriptional regulator